MGTRWFSAEPPSHHWPLPNDGAAIAGLLGLAAEGTLQFRVAGPVALSEAVTALTRSPAYGDMDGTQLAATARDLFADWPPQRPAAVQATSADQLIRNDIYHLDTVLLRLRQSAAAETTRRR